MVHSPRVPLGDRSVGVLHGEPHTVDIAVAAAQRMLLIVTSATPMPMLSPAAVGFREKKSL